MLDRTGNTAGDIKVGRHGLTRLAYLVLERPPTGVDGRPRCADGALQQPGQLLQYYVVLGTLHPSAARDDDVGLGYVDRPARILRNLENLGLERRRVQAGVEFNDFRILGVFHDGKHIGPQRSHLGCPLNDDLAVALTGVHRPDGDHLTVDNLDVGAIRRHTSGEFTDQPGRKVLPLDRSREEEDSRVIGLHGRGDRLGMGVRRVWFQSGVFRHINFVNTVFTKLGGQRLRTGSSDKNGSHFVSQLVCKLPGRTGKLIADLAKGPVSLLCYNPNTFCHLTHLRSFS